MIKRSQLYAAKILGITYLLSLAIIMVAFSRFYAPYLVWENGEETARHFSAYEQAVHVYLAGAFLYGVGMIVLFTAGAVWSDRPSCSFPVRTRREGGGNCPGNRVRMPPSRRG